MPGQLCVYHVDLNYVNIRPDYLRAWLRDIAAMGYNAILWELEDKVAWDTCPAAVWPEAMSKPEFRAVLDEAAALGLEAIPLLQTVGHAEYILKHQPYVHMRELPERHDCYCTEKPAVRDFLKRLIAEYLDLFGDIRRFHLGGDEAYVFARCPQCAALAGRIGRNALYARHIMDIAAPLLQRNVRPGIWGDMILNHPGQIDAIPKALDVWDWNYWAGDTPPQALRVWGQGTLRREQLPPEFMERFPEALAHDGALNGFYTADFLKRMGYDVILCSAVRSSGDSFFLPTTHKHARNIAGAARKAAVAGLAGTCVTDWAIRLNSWETHRGLLPLAPSFLKRPDADVDAVLASVHSELFACDARPFVEAVDLVSGVRFPFSQAHATAVQWNGMKDSLPAPAGYIRTLLQDWEAAGRLDNERQMIDATVDRIAAGMSQLNAFVGRAAAGLDTLHFFVRAAHFQLWQARMAREILSRRCLPANAAFMKMMRSEYACFLGFDQTPLSAAQNAGLVYDALIEFLESG